MEQKDNKIKEKKRQFMSLLCFAYDNDVILLLRRRQVSE